MLRASSYAVTDVGLSRPENEDAFAADDDGQVWLVADGMGGHACGEVAARLTAETVPETLLELERRGDVYARPADLLGRAIAHAQRRLDLASRLDGARYGMGTTVVAATLRDGRVTVAHVGDSRAYRYRDGALERLTRDHTWVEEQVAGGALSESLARCHPLRHVVTRALGGDEASPDCLETDAAPGDLYLLCSDGLTNAVADDELHSFLATAGALDTLCRRLVALANARGGSDNVTVLALRVAEGRYDERRSLDDTLPIFVGALAEPTRELALAG